MSQVSDGITRRSITRTPRWVKLFGIIIGILILMVIILHLTGNSLGGHDMHMPPKTEQRMQQP